LCHRQQPSAAAIGYLPRRSATASLASDESCKLAAVLILTNIAFVCAFLEVCCLLDPIWLSFGMDNITGTGKVKTVFTGPNVAKLQLQLMNFLMTEKMKMVQKM